MKTSFSILLFFSMLLFFSCEVSENTSDKTTSSDTPKASESISKLGTGQEEKKESTKTVEPKQEVVAWVNNLNIRAEPNASAKVVTQAKVSDVLSLTGEKTDHSETITLRGKSFTEPWVQVTTADGKTGWVFQGAVNKKGEDKGIGLSEDVKKKSVNKILSKVSLGECETMKRKEFNCSCVFKDGATTYFVSDWGGNNACIGVKGEANALYPDWEERNYKKEMKELANAKKAWVNVHGNTISYFGKSLEDYKYEDPIELLTDVILASGKDINAIPIQTTTGGDMMDKAKKDNDKAIAKAKAYKANGVDDPLNIVKVDNRTYDVFVRYKQLTERGGEADDYEGKIILLKHRTNEILETRSIKGSCGC